MEWFYIGAIFGAMLNSAIWIISIWTLDMRRERWYNEESDEDGCACGNDCKKPS